MNRRVSALEDSCLSWRSPFSVTFRILTSSLRSEVWSGPHILSIGDRWGGAQRRARSSVVRPWPDRPQERRHKVSEVTPFFSVSHFDSLLSSSAVITGKCKPNPYQVFSGELIYRLITT